MALFRFAAGLRRVLVPNGLSADLLTATMKQTAKDRLQSVTLPEKPKKPLTPYFRFLRDYRNSIMKSPSAAATTKSSDIVRMGAEEWSRVNATIKTKYTAEYQAEMQEYAKLLLAYTAQLSTEQREVIRERSLQRQAEKKKREIRKKSRDLEKPKRPIGPYMQYLQEKSKGGNKSMSELMVELKGHWMGLSDPDKVRYQKMFEEDRQRYNTAMAAWEKEMMDTGNTDIVRRSTLEKSAKAPDNNTLAQKLASFKPKKS